MSKRRETLILREGFWSSEDEPYFPTPEGGLPWKGKKRFLKALARAQKQAHSDAYKGSSNCRLCDRRNGSETYELDGWRWPSGYAHYIEEHNVRPSLAFQEFILGYYLDGDGRA